MKTIKLALLATASAFFAASAQAQVTINLSGAVAFRDVAYRVINNIYGAQIGSVNVDTPANPPASLKVTWTGQIPNLYGAQTVTIHAFYNGAVAGAQDLVQNRNVSYLSSSTAGDTNTVLLASDLAFSSVFQRSTPYTTPVLEDRKFGVTPVFFVKSTSAPAGLTNITSQQFRVLASSGSVPGWFLTGNTNDTAPIYYISRDPTAGQRVIVQKESGYNGSVISYYWDAASSSFLPDTTGRSATQISAALNVSGPAISFLTGVDAINVNGGANILGLNGNKAFLGSYSPTSNNHSPVSNGQYTQWGYEHLLTRTSASQQIKSFRDALLTAIDADLQSSAFSLPVSKVKVERTGEGAPVTPL